MKTVFFFKNMDADEEKQLREYFTIKLKTIEKMVAHFPEDGILLHVKGEKFEKHSAYDVELMMRLPSQKFVARETSHMITKAVDLAKDRLMQQLKKSSEQTISRNHRSVKAKTKREIRMGSLLAET